MLVVMVLNTLSFKGEGSTLAIENVWSKKVINQTEVIPLAFIPCTKHIDTIAISRIRIYESIF